MPQYKPKLYHLTNARLNKLFLRFLIKNDFHPQEWTLIHVSKLFFFFFGLPTQGKV